MVVALALAVALAGIGGVAWARSSSHRATAVVPPPPVTTSAHATPSVSAEAPTDWRQVMTRLDADRDAAFARGDETLLDRVYVRGSAPDATDRSALHALVVQHLHARGLRLVIESVQVGAATRTSVALSVVDRLPAYDVVDEHNRRIAHRPVRPSHTWRIRVVLTFAGWRIASIG
jgi:hypothetical protein